MVHFDKVFSGTSHFYETVCHSLTQTRRFIEQSDRVLLGQATSVY